MKNDFLEGLYEMAGVSFDDTSSKFDEQRLRKELEGNTKLLSRNADAFREGEPRFHTCLSYDPCPICDKCRNKASHLYVKCQICEIPICVHTYKDREKMIKRHNFRFVVTEETMNKLKEVSSKMNI